MKALYFHTNTLAELINCNVKDREIIIGEKKFYPDTSKSIDFKTPFGVVPLYLLKWDCVYPGKIAKTQIIERKIGLEEIRNAIRGTAPVERNVIGTIVFTRDAKNIPESLYKTEKLKILGGMFRIKRELGLIPIGFGLLVGSIVMFLLFYFKFLRI